MTIDTRKGVMEYRQLGGTDLQVSALGFGTAPLGDVYGATDPAESLRALHTAIDRGINFFDSSPYYGLQLAEQRLGTALVGKRDAVVLASEVGRYRLADLTSRRAATDRLDLLQAHDVEFADFHQIVNETIPALRKIQQSGKARFIGITGYPPRFLARVARQVPVDTILSYCHYNLLATNLDDELTPFARSHFIGLINASALHMGVLTPRGAPPWHTAPHEVRAAGRRIDELGDPGTHLAARSTKKSSAVLERLLTQTPLAIPSLQMPFAR